ncbi:acylglycerol lipase [Fusarium albosuccineum]|uniref:Acylglycerol lipase n=1 Tax=Fusarium albosuccineum TaxID=1237068 RepID=A0A8H4L169_9HYPO|nr:acylglycerol lipase [Fusarium albosuccineum]
MDSPSLPHDHQFFNLSPGVVAHKWQCESPSAIVILQHGFGEYAERFVRSYSGLIPNLNRKGFEVWALDLRGHGRSPGERGSVDVELAVQDCLELRQQALMRKLPVFLFGHSLGGFITAASTVKNPDGIAGVILSSPALPDTMSLPGELAIGLLARMMPSVQIPKPRSPLEWRYRDTEQVRAMWARLDEWDAPILVIHGTGDVSADFRQSERFVQQIKAEDKTLHLVEGGYHELLNDEKAKETLDIIIDWLQKRVE